MAEEVQTEEVVTAVKDGRERAVKPSIAGAVRAMRERMPAVRPNGIFQHPDDWTQEELDFIVDCLKQHIPIYTIANMVHCERHALGRLINRTPYMKELIENRYEDFIEELEYQFDKLIKAGNVAMVIHGLNTIGKRRGNIWTEGAVQEGGGGDSESRIVMGLIPQEEVDKAEGANNKIKEEFEKTNGANTSINPMQMAITQEMVKEEVSKQVEAMKPEAIEADAVDVSSPPYQSGESVTDVAIHQDYESYGNTGAGYPQQADPWASGADSPFFQ